MKIDFIGPIRLVFLILFIIAGKGTALFWLGLYLLLKEIKFWIKWRSK